LAEIAERFLKEPAPKKRAFRDRRAAAGLAARQLEAALRFKVGKQARELVKRNLPIDGQLDTHKFDVGVVNGATYVVAQGLSFEVPESDDLDKEVEATAWAVDDVRHGRPGVPIAIVTLRSSAESRAFGRAERIFSGLGASVILEDMIPDWASTVAARVKPL